MSEASKTGGVIFSQKSGVYMPAIMCNKGDLYQEYLGESSAPSNISPDFETLQPILSFLLTSSRVSEGIVVPSEIKWYFNGVLLSFTNNISTNNFGGTTGHFKFIPYQAGTNNYYGLQIVKNLVASSSGASCNIKAEATILIGNSSDKIGSTYSIPITRGVGNQKHVTISSGDNKYFALRTKGSSCILTAVTRMGADEITSGLSYKWYKMDSGVWTLLTSTGKSLTVTEGMVDTTGIFKVEVFKDYTLLGIDTQTVMDLSDPYDIMLNPVPEDETIESGTGGTVVYTPILVRRGETTKAKDVLFLFTFMDSSGIILNTSTSGTPSATGTCTEAMCQQAGGNVAYIITTEE